LLDTKNLAQDISLNLLDTKNLAQDISLNLLDTKNLAQDISLNSLPTFSGANTFTNTNYFSTISEKITTTPISSNAISCNYSLGGIFQISGIQPSANFTANIINLPSITNSNQTYIISLIYTPSSGSFYCNVATASSTGSTGSSATFLINGGTTVSNSAKLTIQQLMFYYDGSIMKVLSNVSAFS